MAQQGSISNCYFTNHPIAVGDSAIFEIDWSVLGTGPLPQSITLSPPSGAIGEWDLSTFEVVLTDVSGTWTAAPWGAGNGVKISYTGSIVDGNYARFRIKCLHDGITDTLSSGVANVQPGTAYCINRIPVSLTSLAMKIGSFDVTSQGTSAKLQWVTESEQNSSHFNIEASVDGENFETIAIVNSQSDENGNSETPLVYAYTDESASKRADGVYYRLRLLDLNGNHSYSAVSRVELEGKDYPLTAWPNPIKAGELVSIEGNEFSKIEIMNTLGQSVYAQDHTTPVNSAQIPTRDLTPGIYILQLDSEKNTRLLVQ